MLRAVREAGGVSRDQMAEECGVSPGTISHWESGRSIPARAHLKVWGELCEVPLADLYRIIGLSGEPLSLPHFWRARSGTIPASAGGITTAATDGNGGSEGAKRQLPRAYHPFAPVPVLAAAF
jgi:transcriptional regulator with XRE-family HTH domain